MKSTFNLEPQLKSCYQNVLLSIKWKTQNKNFMFSFFDLTFIKKKLKVIKFII